MAKKKNNASWLPPAQETESAAKKAIQKTSKLNPEKKKAGRPVGRPKAIKGDTIQVQVSVEARNWVKKLAVLEGTTMMEYLTDLILKEARDKGYLKE